MRGGTPHLLRAALHWPVLLPAAGLVLLGLAFLKSFDLAATQAVGAAAGCALAIALVLVPYKEWVAKAYLLYAGNILLLVLVLVAGRVANNSRRWLEIPLLGQFQPSEFMKLTLVLTLARFIRFKSSYKTFKGLTAPFLLTFLPMALVLPQPDLGTALLCIPVLFTMLFCAGARTRHLLAIALLGAASMLPVYGMLHDYQKARITSYFATFVSGGGEERARRHEREGKGYQLHQSLVAIGSGGVMGVGVGEGKAHAAAWVPERHTDFIFAVVGNESGFLGAAFVLFLFGVLLTAILAVAWRHRDPAGRLLCVGVFALLGAQAFVNVAMTVGLVPITGVTLPFLSFGRSSLVTSLAAIGLVCNVAARPSYEFGRGDFD